MTKPQNDGPPTPGDSRDARSSQEPAQPETARAQTEPSVAEPGETPERVQEPEDERPPGLPEQLGIVPLRNVVVFPLAFLPLSVSQARSLRLVEEATVGDRVVGLVALKDPDVEDPGPEDLYSVGTAAYIHRMVKGSDGNIGLFVQGQQRFRIESFVETEPYLKARVSAMGGDEAGGEGAELELEALTRNVTELFGRLVDLVPHLPQELMAALESMEDPRALSYFIAANTRMEVAEAQKMLEMETVELRIRALISMLTRELDVLELGRRIQREARGEMEKAQREFFLRQQLKAIQKELGEGDEREAELEQLETQIHESGMPDEARDEALRELGRLKSLPEASAEYGVIRGYLDWMVSLPWSEKSEDNLDIAHARAVLDEDHYGLEDIKSRILEFLAVQKLRLDRGVEDRATDAGGAILVFIGPPGVGKTSLGRSIARALGRKFVRMSLGGMRDEAEIRGHRRTYIGAMPGKIIQELKRAGTRNPVFMLDEIDKVGASFRGDPQSALLEVLDPAQNQTFRDLYLDVPFDLSDVLFVATGNVLSQISGPLRDRMEVIELAGYTEQDKLQIARGYLIPRQVRENGLEEGEIAFHDEAVLEIIRHHTREAGVRNLERQLGKICRKVAVAVAEGSAERVEVGVDDLRAYLGARRYEAEVAERTSIAGVATGLAYTPYGGDVLFIEASASPGQKAFTVTGQLGDVMRESAQAALSYVRAQQVRLGIPAGYFAEHDLHLHVPAGATPKDGPSAGVAMATALVSLITDTPVRSDVGMTGEITLRGKVLPVGGIKEKVLAAHRAGLRCIILPERNLRDLDEVPEEVRADMRFEGVSAVDEVWEFALERRPWLDAEAEA